MKCQILSSGKNKKKYTNLLSAVTCIRSETGNRERAVLPMSSVSSPNNIMTDNILFWEEI